MKTKNLIVGAAAFVFAVGSVFANMAAQTPFVKYLKTGEETPRCQALSGTCDETGTAACRIKVNGTAYQAFQSLCVTPLKNTDGSTVIDDVTIANVAQIFNTPL